MTTQIGHTLEEMRKALQLENDDLERQIKALQTSFDANAIIIQGITKKQRCGTISGSVTNKDTQDVEDDARSDDGHGWLISEVRKFLDGNQDFEFSIADLIQEIRTQTNREPKTSSIYTVMKRLVDSNAVTQTMEGRGRTPAKFKATAKNEAVTPRIRPGIRRDLTKEERQ